MYINDKASRKMQLFVEEKILIIIKIKIWVLTVKVSLILLNAYDWS